jgi:hypothetical protein
VPPKRLPAPEGIDRQAQPINRYAVSNITYRIRTLRDRRECSCFQYVALVILRLVTLPRRSSTWTVGVLPATSIANRRETDLHQKASAHFNWFRSIIAASTPQSPLGSIPFTGSLAA